MKIWYLLPRMNLGGSEKHVLRLAAGLRQRGHETGIACIFREGFLAEEARREGIPFVCLEAGAKWEAGTAFRIARWIRSTEMNILHTYLFGFHVFAGLPARILKVPVLLSSRRDVDYWQRKRDLWIERAGNLFVDRVICCAKAAEHWVLEKEKIRSEKVLTIYNGVDLNRFNPRTDSREVRQALGIPEHAPLIGTVASIAHKKGYLHLIEAARKILGEEPSAWFLFVGSGPLEKEMKERAGQIPRHEQIIFTEARLDIPELIGAMDIFVLASLFEGLPNVLLEAMAMAKPVVATRVGGIPELVDSGVDGILVPPADGASLATAILSLLADRERIRQMGRRGREKVERNFSLESMIDRYENFYLSLLEEKGLAKRSLNVCAAS